MTGPRGAALRLSLATLARVPVRASPRIDPREVTGGIVHLGIGAFHRAHQAVFTEDAMATTGDLTWGICGVSPRSRTVVDRLAPQDGLYAVLERAPGEPDLRVVAAVRAVLPAADEPTAVLDRIADPSTRILSLTVTEKAYRVGPADRHLDLADPDVRDDLTGRPPRTVPGLLAAGLGQRMRADAGPLTVLCCDNLPGNGAVVRRVVGDFCARLPDGERLTGWLGESVRFPSTMVDRIVPATVDSDRDEASRRLGLRDEGTVVAEPFRQWVIEDSFAAGRPRWESAGATMTDAVAPYEAMKLRLLNGSHSTLAYLGALAGCEFIADAVRTPELGELVHALMRREVLPTLTVPTGFDVDAYIAALLDRFANPALHHRTSQVAMDGSQKLPQRLLPVARELLARGREPRLVALSVAGWMRYVTAGHAETGEPLPVEDPLAPRIAELTGHRDSPARTARALLGLAEVFGPELAADETFRSLVTDHLDRLTRDGVRGAVRAALRD